jgi:hypothetical protein
MSKSISDVVADSEYLLKLNRPAELLPNPTQSKVMCPVISVDDHVLEPADLFSRIPAKLRDSGPELVRGDQGRPFWKIDGKLYPIAGVNGAVGRPMTQWNAYALDYDEFRPGVSEVNDRLADMDLNGVWASLNFPSVTWGFAGRAFFDMEDPAAGHAAMTAYNEWMIEEWCGAQPDRFIPCQICWMPDPIRGANEILRESRGVGSAKHLH